MVKLISNTDSLLKIALSFSVPLRIISLKENGGVTEKDFKRVTEYNYNIFETSAEYLLFKSEKKGETAKMFNAVADAISVLSFVPGGITIFGSHWESK